MSGKSIPSGSESLIGCKYLSSKSLPTVRRVSSNSPPMLDSLAHSPTPDSKAESKSSPTSSLSTVLPIPAKTSGERLSALIPILSSVELIMSPPNSFTRKAVGLPVAAAFTKP